MCDVVALSSALFALSLSLSVFICRGQAVGDGLELGGEISVEQTGGGRVELLGDGRLAVRTAARNHLRAHAIGKFLAETHTATNRAEGREVSKRNHRVGGSMCATVPVLLLLLPG